MLLDLDQLWTVEQAAEHAKVKPATIRSWIHRGHLDVAERDENGRPKLKPLDVARAEFRTRERARRPAPQRYAAA